MASNSNSIMVVDDEQDIANIIKRTLEEIDGFKVCTFTDSLAALEHFNSDCKDHRIIISDIRMPGMNGYEFVKQIKKTNPQVNIILMSAFELSNKEFSNKLPDVNIDAFIQKPFLLKTLRNIVKEQIDKRTIKLM